MRFDVLIALERCFSFGFLIDAYVLHVHLNREGRVIDSTTQVTTYRHIQDYELRRIKGPSAYPRAGIFVGEMNFTIYPKDDLLCSPVHLVVVESVASVCNLGVFAFAVATAS